MKRIALEDGRWFDQDKATAFDEDTWWDGRNDVSRATGSQFEHEVLYLTAGERWVKHNWSQWQGTSDVWEEIDPADAVRWLVVNGHEPHKGMDKDFSALEI